MPLRLPDKRWVAIQSLAQIRGTGHLAFWGSWVSFQAHRHLLLAHSVLAEEGLWVERVNSSHAKRLLGTQKGTVRQVVMLRGTGAAFQGGVMESVVYEGTFWG